MKMRRLPGTDRKERSPARVEKKDNNEDEDRAKKKRRISTEGRREDWGREGRREGATTNEREKKEEAGEAEAGNLDRVVYPLEPWALAADDPPLCPLG